jgi:delta1-piperideine-2-carboxylate reductase
MSDENNQHLELSEVEKICRDALSASGLNPVATAAVTEVVTTAERDGCHSHGLFRVPGYCKALLSGTVDGTTQPRVFDVAPGVVRVDAARGYAPPAILAGRDLAVRKARENGISCLAIHNSFHFAALWWEVEALANEGIVSLAFVNSRSFVAHQPGGKRKLYGTNPMAFGFPRAASTAAADDDGGNGNGNGNGNGDDENLTTDTKRGPLVWDQASAAMARGEIQLCQRDGHTLPEGVAIDRDGRPTTCPEAALVGFITGVT